MSTGALGYDAEVLARAAVEAAKRAYNKYSGYQVGAALLTKDGTLYTGCNIENAAYSATICAERTAISKAVSDGHREFIAMAVCTPNGGTPCGICRQVINEFGETLPIIITTAEGIKYTTTLDRLLPDAFGPRQMQHKLNQGGAKQP
jgi:cytidine deaminase